MIKYNNAIKFMVIAGCAVCMFSACSGNSGQTQSAGETVRQETATEENTTAQETETSETTVPETKKEEPQTSLDDSGKEYLSLSTSSYYDSLYDDTNLVTLYSVNAQKIHVNTKAMYGDFKITQEDVPALYDTLEAYNKKQEQYAIEWVESSKEDINMMLEDADMENFPSYEYRTDILVQRADKDVLSFLNQAYIYQGGAHGTSFCSGYNYDTATGDVIELGDVVSDMGKLSDILYDKLMSQHKGELFENPKDTIDSMIADNTLYWTLGYDGITCYFNQYDIAPYAAGMLPVKIGFAEFPELFEEKYTVTVDNYAFQILPYTDFYFDIDGDGVDDNIMVSYDKDENGIFDTMSVTVGDSKASSECYCYQIIPTFIHLSDGRNYIYMDVSEDNDYETIYVFDVSKTPKFVEYEGNAGVIGYSDESLYEYRTLVITDPYRYELESRGNLISTASVYKTYHVSDTGMPVSEDMVYSLPEPFLKITSKVELTLEDTQGQKVTFPAGTVFDVLYTDNESYAELSTDSKLYRLPVEAGNNENWYRKVDGMDLEDVFDGVFFAG